MTLYSADRGKKSLDYVYRSIYHDTYSHYRMRLDYIDATLYPCWSLKKSLDHVYRSMYHAAFRHCRMRSDYFGTKLYHLPLVTIKRGWRMLICRCTCTMQVMLKRAWIMLNGSIILRHLHLVTAKGTCIINKIRRLTMLVRSP